LMQALGLNQALGLLVKTMATSFAKARPLQASSNATTT
jgi:hypothetical protein